MRMKLFELHNTVVFLAETYQPFICCRLVERKKYFSGVYKPRSHTDVARPGVQSRSF